MTKYVNADPYAWPYNGDLRPQNTDFLVIDMQSDFCGLGGYVDKMGYVSFADARTYRTHPKRARGLAAEGFSRHAHARGAQARSCGSAGE